MTVVKIAHEGSLERHFGRVHPTELLDLQQCDFCEQSVPARLATWHKQKKHQYIEDDDEVSSELNVERSESLENFEDFVKRARVRSQDETSLLDELDQSDDETARSAILPFNVATDKTTVTCSFRKMSFNYDVTSRLCEFTFGSF